MAAAAAAGAVIDLDDHYDPDTQLAAEAEIAGLDPAALSEQLIDISGCSPALATGLLLAGGLDINRAVNLHLASSGSGRVLEQLHRSSSSVAQVVDLSSTNSGAFDLTSDDCTIVVAAAAAPAATTAGTQPKRRRQVIDVEQQAALDEEVARRVQVEWDAQEAEAAEEAASASASTAAAKVATEESAKDLCWRQRRDIDSFLRRTCGPLRIEEVKANPSSLPSTPMYEAFLAAHATAQDKTIRECLCMARNAR